MIKNYYIALRFEGRGDLHMTLRYHKSLNPRNLADLIYEVHDKITRCTHIEKFNLVLDRILMFGGKRDVRVLLPKRDSIIWPRWILQFTTRGWSPHVSCQDESLSLTVNAIAIMTKQIEIVRWKLPC